MFTHDVNGTFSRSVKNQPMHPTYQRLAEALQIAREVDGPIAPGEIANLMGESAQTVTNWRSRGVSQAGIVKASTKFGIRAAFIEKGVRPELEAIDLGFTESLEAPVFSKRSEASALAPINAGGNRPSALRKVLERLQRSDVQSNVEDAPALKENRLVPVVGEVKGGDDGFLEELQYPVGHGEGSVDYPTSDSSAYALRVRGDSMHPRYRAGEFIVVTPSITAQPSDDVVVALKDGRKLLKVLNWIQDEEIQLLSVNNHFGPLTLQLSEVEFVHLVDGRVRRSAFHRG